MISPATVPPPIAREGRATAVAVESAPIPASTRDSVPLPAAEPTATPEGPVPDPFQDTEALEDLEKKITTLAARIHAATHRLLTLIAEFDRRRGWELGGHRSCAHWLSYRTGIDLGTAREKVRTARALTLLLCRHHHRMVHEGGWTVRMKDKGQPVFLSPQERPLAGGG